MSFPFALVIVFFADPLPTDPAIPTPTPATESVGHDSDLHHPQALANTIGEEFIADGTPEPTTQEFGTANGFLFIDGTWQGSDRWFEWKDGLLTKAPSTAAPIGLKLVDPPMFSDSAGDASEWCLPLSADQFTRVKRTLEEGGLVLLSTDQDPWSLPLSDGGIEALSALTLPPGTQRTQLISDLAQSVSIPLPVGTRPWFAAYRAPDQLLSRAERVLNRVSVIEESNLAAVTAFERFDLWNYPVTLGAMLTCVVAIGSLISVRPAELVADSFENPDSAINRFLVLIVAMSAIDLVWTLLAHQARVITEINPLGGVIIDDTPRLIVFKVLATALAVSILYRARHAPIARKVCWWSCLTLSLLTARWVIISGVTT